MGCCHSENPSVMQDNFPFKLKEAIDLGSASRITTILEYFHKKDPRADPPYIDKEITAMNNVSLNGLAYCLLHGKTSMFKFLYEQGASIKAMEETLIKHNLKGINLICYKGHKDLLEFYLPIYLKDYISIPQSVKSYTIDLKDTQNFRPEFDLPIHSACRAEMINIVSYLYKYFKGKQYCPREFDILALDEFNGEDCSLISCRSGCYTLVKFFHEICQINFTQLNSHNENAIMICVAGYNRNPNFTYIECLQYLINVVGLDITYKYEELLCIAEGKDMVQFIEDELEKKGINTKKKDLDLSVNKVQVVVDTIDKINGPLFNEDNKKLVEPENRSFLSTISNVEQHPDRPNSDFFSQKFE